ncbi:hypothetical protein AB0L05_21220 [Nonomuraea pusilla]|uniref:hypothetical protein n=1 Tax=Nonomuraea pusilla TaxID=46177 RepID=UPI00331FBD6C
MRTLLYPLGSSLAVLGAALALVTLPHVSARADTAAGERYIDSFFTEAGCRKAGADGVGQRKWSHYICVKAPFDRLGTWDLWVK